MLDRIFDLAKIQSKITNFSESLKKTILWIFFTMDVWVSIL